MNETVDHTYVGWPERIPTPKMPSVITEDFYESGRLANSVSGRPSLGDFLPSNHIENPKFKEENVMKTPSVKTAGSKLTKGTTPSKPNNFNAPQASKVVPATGGRTVGQ